MSKLNLKQNIFYWSPFLVPIATPKAVVNSAKALQNYGKEYMQIYNETFDHGNIKSKLLVIVGDDWVITTYGTCFYIYFIDTNI